MKVVTLTLGVVLCVAWIGSHVAEMAPLIPSNSVEFWKHACQVDIAGRFKGREDEWGSYGCNVYPPQGEWYVYYDQHLHGQSSYRVAAIEADADLSKAVEAIEAHNDLDRQWVNSGLAAWRQLPVAEQTAISLQLAMRKAWIDGFVVEYPKSAKSSRRLWSSGFLAAARLQG